MDILREAGYAVEYPYLGYETGFRAVVGLAIVALGAGMGYSGAAMIVVASLLTIRYALKVQADPTKSYVYNESIIG